MIKCKDCGAETDQDPREAHWQWLDITEDPRDIGNGWRCPQCAEGWRMIVEESFH